MPNIIFISFYANVRTVKNFQKIYSVFFGVMIMRNVTQNFAKNKNSEFAFTFSGLNERIFDKHKFFLRF